MKKSLFNLACFAVFLGANPSVQAADASTEEATANLISRIQASADCKASFFKGCPPVSVATVASDEWWPELKKTAVWAVKRNPGTEVSVDPTAEAMNKFQRIFEKWCEENNGFLRDQSPDAFRLIAFRREFPQQYTLRNGLRCHRRNGQTSVTFTPMEFLERYSEPARITPQPIVGVSAKDEAEYVRRYNKEHANLPVRFLVIQTDADWKSAESVSRLAEVAFNQACRDGDPKILNTPDCQVLRKMESYRQQDQKPTVIKGTL